MVSEGSAAAGISAIPANGVRKRSGFMAGGLILMSFDTINGKSSKNTIHFGVG
jgi:hypothetical protein